ncbi:hypothetical protein NDU88_000572 [Pleurodeles waltl]|uniref:Uncharacterized protein n=1 Tax=Pleurodeles waltl TaxID=8319 RepID=A0AAV7TH59_PLEWA|nr:hypothetical protein NDU88_000572 [Pleurodeles waltl]
MVKRKARSSPPGGVALTKMPKLHQAPNIESSCVTDEIDNLIEEVETLLTKKEKVPQKRLKDGSLTSYLKSCDKGNIAVSGAAMRPLPTQAEGLNICTRELCGAQASPQITSLGSVIIHDIPCSNRFSLLEPQGQIEDLGNSNSSTRLISHHSSILQSQEDLIAFVLELKKEMKDLKTSITEVLTLLRTKSYYRETPIMHKTELNANIGLNEELVTRKKTLSCVKSIPDRNIIAPQIGSTSLSSTKIDPQAPMSSRPCAVFSREAPIGQTLHQPRGSGYPICMCRVPPLAPNAQEDRASLINKVTHWIRYTRQCGSIIHSDIISAQRYPKSEGHLDTIKLVLSAPELVRGLLSLETRNPLQNGSNICFKSCWPAEDSQTRSDFSVPNPSLRSAKENSLVISEEITIQANKKEYASQNELLTTRRLVQVPVAVETD